MIIHTVMSAQTYKYFEYCVNNHTELAAKPERLKFATYALDQRGYDMAVEFSKSARAPVDVIRLRDGSGSIGHMIGLNAIFERCDQNDEINVISDSDCIVLMKGWDTWLSDAINVYGYGALGTTYEDLGGFSSGTGRVQTYKKAPNFSWCALAPVKSEAGPQSWQFDTSADKLQTYPIRTQEESEIWNIPVGYELYREPCWRFPEFLKKNNITSYPFKFVRPTSSDAKAVLSGEDYHTEYQLFDGTPYVAHQRGSMSKKFKVDHLSKTFYDACEAYIRKNHG